MEKNDEASDGRPPRSASEADHRFFDGSTSKDPHRFHSLLSSHLDPACFELTVFGIDNAWNGTWNRDFRGGLALGHCATKVGAIQELDEGKWGLFWVCSGSGLFWHFLHWERGLEGHWREDELNSEIEFEECEKFLNGLKKAKKEGAAVFGWGSRG